MSHPIGHPEFIDNGNGLCWHCGRTAFEHPGITQSEIARQDIRERDDFAAVRPEMVDQTFYIETNAREELADGLVGFELPARRTLPPGDGIAAERDDKPTACEANCGKEGRGWAYYWKGDLRVCADCLDSPDSVGPFPAVPTFNSPEAVREAAETIQATHTPGPWKCQPISDRVLNHNRGFEIRGPETEMYVRGVRDNEILPNARLIAAAPELADALEPLLETVEILLRFVENTEGAYCPLCSWRHTSARGHAPDCAAGRELVTARAALESAGRSI